ncbi:hypothetical protein [Paracraurococcus lichenis]|uniref:Lipoprotein n=1 Tax=Paracraurococcus lichenis TaxID=3064888 RepID=A0ABT9E521_9PROT|nr:hypothetical protein [Paracraurococcus sp. LOR1-02]MDO9711264.1 hypothetical protein [Paracraurococcus sp. LOR1-02]
MRTHTLLAGLLAGLALAACADLNAPSGPPVSGTTAGPGAAPLKQEARDTMGANSGNASGGTATITGTRTTGEGGTRPEVTYSGQSGSSGVGSTTPVQPTVRSRSNKGGG